MNDKLAAPITKDELMWVAKNMAQDSAPCPDGFVIKFCTMFKEIIGDDYLDIEGVASQGHH
jgi:hypothetical protein